MRTGKPLTMDRKGFEGMDLEARKEQVAAHQAMCSCHPASGSCCDPAADVQGHDRDGRPWHIDPLCKVRPEARPQPPPEAA